jgi:TfoX/Sxy family transcriptional regulator of competence genes
MAFDEGLAARVREALQGVSFVTEKRMFGGLTFMINGHMCCGVMGDRLMLRVGAPTYEQTLLQPHVRPMDFTNRPLTGFVFVQPGGLEDDDELAAWVQRGVDFAGALPPKDLPNKRRIKRKRT